MKRLTITTAMLIGLMGASAYVPTSAAQSDHGHETYCAKNDAAGYAGRLFIKYRSDSNDDWHHLMSPNISSPYEQCLEAPRGSSEIIVQLRMLSLGAAVGIDSSWLSLHDESTDIHNCHYHQRRNRDGSNNSGKHGIHGINFEFHGLATNPQCRSELH